MYFGGVKKTMATEKKKVDSSKGCSTNSMDVGKKSRLPLKKTLVKHVASEDAKERIVKMTDKDLSLNAEIAFVVANQIQVEEHSFKSFQDTGDKFYLDLWDESRRMRGKLMKEIVPLTDGEQWCASKHILSIFYRLAECSSKAPDNLRLKLVGQSKRYWEIFWKLQLHVAEKKGLLKKE